MSLVRLIAAGVVHHWRINVAVVLGVAAATAVLTGALAVGDSVRGSLRHLALDRLQGVDEALVVPRFFRAELASELAAEPEFRQSHELAVPAIVLEGTVESPASHARAARVNLIGCDKAVFALGSSPSAKDLAPPAPGEISLNEALATELGLAPGGECIVRLPVAREVPADSPLGRKTETVTTLRLKVARILGAGEMESFVLRPNQAMPRNAFLNLGDVQRVLKQPDKVNAILVGHQPAPRETPPSLSALAADHDKLQALLHPELIDYGLSIRQVPAGYFLLESDRMLLEPAAVAAAVKAFGPLGAQPAFTYLANTLADGEREIPYSTIAAIDFAPQPPLGGFVAPDGKPVAPLADDEIALVDWAAEDLNAKVGDTIRVTYFEPESTHGNVREKTVALRLAAIVALTGAAADPNLTPTLPGVTDQLSIADWNPPFPFDSQRIRPKDEQYWDDHKATPKAYVALATGRKLWGSRFGDTTSLRIPPGEGRTAESLAVQLRPDPAAMGFVLQPVKLQALWASQGTTSFGGLYLGFSFFIIAAAVMLVAILFRLGVEQRAPQVGVLLAVGWPVRKVRWLLMGEGAIVASIGALVGLALGAGYAWLMLAGLRTWWLAAITTPFLRLYVTPMSLAMGWLTSVVISLVTIWFSLRRLGRYEVRSLLTSRVIETAGGASGPSRWPRRMGWAALALAVALGAAGSRLSASAQAGAFFGSGTLVLAGLLTLLPARLRSAAGGSAIVTGRAPLARLAVRNAARHPGRSTLTVGLIAAASFLIIAVSAFRLDPNAAPDSRESGTGGFALVAESDQPIYQDLNTDDGQLELGFSAADRRALAGAHIFALRAAGGADASCLNLYHTEQPRVLGVPESLLARGGFAWASGPRGTANPWQLLDEPLPDAAPGSDAVPVVIDEATAKYSLHLSGVGSTYDIADGRGGRLSMQVAGLLKNSILQGVLLIGERAFLEHFPDTSGYRFFLVDAPRDQAPRAAAALESTLGDFGLDAERTVDRLAAYSAVQNTYLSTFQSLGGLGLLLGTFGLATVQLRNVIERRGELALLRAAGFRRALVARIVLWENALLLAGGLAAGAAAALVAVAPHLAVGGAGLPWLALAGTLIAVLAIGLVAGAVAAWAVLQAPIVPALRGD
ncbi:MAG: FtsX-like permease family protein [Planctomycetia bacterium]|nr:FtsX-like permease family protein [Planctomycetia bacterium]